LAKSLPVKKKFKEKVRKKSAGKQIIAEQLKLFEEHTKARSKIAKAAYEAQDEETKEALDLLRSRVATMSSGYIRIFPNGKRNPSIAVPIAWELAEQNILFIATEILKDLALMDIQVANYQFPKVYCAECGDKLTPRKKKRK